MKLKHNYQKLVRFDFRQGARTATKQYGRTKWKKFDFDVLCPGRENVNANACMVFVVQPQTRDVELPVKKNILCHLLSIFQLKQLCHFSPDVTKTIASILLPARCHYNAIVSFFFFFNCHCLNKFKGKFYLKIGYYLYPIVNLIVIKNIL